MDGNLNQTPVAPFEPTATTTTAALPVATEIPVTSYVQTDAESLGLKIVSVQRANNVLFITVEGSNFELVGDIESRKLAYDARFNYGFENAGIEPGYRESPSNTVHRMTWKLTRGVV